jgi:hypothetical protein
MKNYQLLLTAVVSLGISWGILSGVVQQWVHFAGPLNEMFCFILSSTMGIMCLFGVNYKGLYRWLVR